MATAAIAHPNGTLLKCTRRRKHADKSTHTCRYALDEEAMGVCVTTEGEKMRRKWVEEALGSHKKTTADAQTESHKHARLRGCVHRCARSHAASRCIPRRLGASAQLYTLVAHAARRTGTFTHAPGIACDRCWQEYCQEESAFVSFYSLCILACLALYTVWPCHRGCFFSLPVPLWMQAPLPPFLFLSPVIMELKSYVPREIRRESG